MCIFFFQISSSLQASRWDRTAVQEEATRLSQASCGLRLVSTFRPCGPAFREGHIRIRLEDAAAALQPRLPRTRKSAVASRRSVVARQMDEENWPDAGWHGAGRPARRASGFLATDWWGPRGQIKGLPLPAGLTEPKRCGVAVALLMALLAWSGPSARRATMSRNGNEFNLATSRPAG